MFPGTKFQLTSPFGDEPYLHLHLLPQRQLKFQFTSPRGDELKMARVLVRVYHFNSHLREETNKNSISPQQNKKIFQLTSPQGDEHLILLSVLSANNFKSRFLAETNGFLLSGVLCQRISTHASAKRRTLMYLLLHCYPLFQLTSP